MATAIQFVRILTSEPPRTGDRLQMLEDIQKVDGRVIVHMPLTRMDAPLRRAMAILQDQDMFVHPMFPGPFVVPPSDRERWWFTPRGRH